LGTSNGLHSGTSQKKVFFIASTVKTLNPKICVLAVMMIICIFTSLGCNIILIVALRSHLLQFSFYRILSSHCFDLLLPPGHNEAAVVDSPVLEVPGTYVVE
jgi:hypothetical protein